MTLSEESSALGSNKATFVDTHPTLTPIHIRLRVHRTAKTSGQCIKLNNDE